MKDFLTTEDVGARLGVGIAQVQKLVHQGRLPFVRNGRRIVFPRPAWEAFLVQQSEAALAAMREAGHVDVT